MGLSTIYSMCIQSWSLHGTSLGRGRPGCSNGCAVRRFSSAAEAFDTKAALIRVWEGWCWCSYVVSLLDCHVKLQDLFVRWPCASDCPGMLIKLLHTCLCQVLVNEKNSGDGEWSPPDVELDHTPSEAARLSGPRCADLSYSRLWFHLWENSCFKRGGWGHDVRMDTVQNSHHENSCKDLEARRWSLLLVAATQQPRGGVEQRGRLPCWGKRPPKPSWTERVQAEHGGIGRPEVYSCGNQMKAQCDSGSGRVCDG